MRIMRGHIDEYYSDINQRKVVMLVYLSYSPNSCLFLSFTEDVTNKLYLVSFESGTVQSRRYSDIEPYH